MEEMTQSLNGVGRDFVDLDVEFHLTIAQCAKNQMLFELLTPIRGVLKEWISKSQELPGIKENAHGQHAKILAAVRSREPEKARHAMRAHLQTCEKMFSLLGRISGTKEHVGV
jgi:DNA-binding FadR family transcriptional regulator